MAKTAWIETLDEDAVSGELLSLYRDALQAGSRRLDHIIKVHSLHPAGLAAHLALYRSSMAGTKGLSKLEREMVAVQVSKINGCHY